MRWEERCGFLGDEDGGGAGLVLHKRKEPNHDTASGGLAFDWAGVGFPTHAMGGAQETQDIGGT